MRALVLCDDFYHPAVTVRTGLAPLAQSGFAFDWIENAQDWSADRMAQYPLVVLVKSNNVSSTDQTNWVTEEVQASFTEYVQQGNGLLAIHSGTAGYQETAELRSLLGGVFLQHPAQCPVTIEPVADHPLTSGSAPFTVKDEHYFMALDDQQADMFMTTRSENGSQPGGWTRKTGAGRVCVLTPGHNAEVWLHPSFQALLLNGMIWCGIPNEER